MNITASDDNLDSIWFNNGTSNVTYTGPVYVTFQEGSNTLYAFVNDSAGNVNMSSVMFFVYICSPNITNTSWSSWSNLTCAGNQMNQSRFLTQYDSNNCGVVLNQTIYQYQLVGPAYYNTSWSAWLNISCLFGDTMNQTRNLTQYDAYSCAMNTTFFEYNVIICDYDGAPKIYINSPLNTTYNNKTQLVNISVIDSAVDRIWFFNGTANVSYSLPVYTLFNEGSNTLYAWANDSIGNVNWTSVMFYINTSLPDPTPPVIVSTQIEPYDPYLGGNVSLSMSATDNVNISGIFANITLPNGSVIVVPLGANYTITLIGRYNVTFFANDTSGNIATFEDYFIAGEIPINVTFNAIDYLLNGIPVNLTLYFAGTDKEIHLHNFTGIKLDLHTDIFYDLLFESINDGTLVKLLNVNLSRYNNNTLGLDKDTAYSGYLVVYGVNSSYGFSMATLRIGYAGIGYSDENALILEKCDNWEFENRTCLGTWSDITLQALKNTIEHYFEVNTTSFSGFGIREPAVVPSESSNNGGSGAPARLANLETSSDLIEITLLQGETKTVDFELKNNDAREFDIGISFEALDRLVTAVPNSFRLGFGKSMGISLEFYASSTMEPGVYAGKIVIDSGFGKKIINVLLTVKERKPLLDMTLKVADETERVYNGDKVNYAIDLLNIGLDVDLDVELETMVADLDKNIMLRLPTESFVLEKNRSLRKIMREFSVPMNLRGGKYIVLARANYRGLSAEAYDGFEVLSKEYPIKQTCNLYGLLISLILIAIAILIILIVLARRKRKVAVKRCRAEGEVRREMSEMKDYMRKSFRHFRQKHISRDEYMHRKVLYLERMKELEQELKDIIRMKSTFTEKELITLGAMKHRLNYQLIRLNKEYKRGTIETEGYKKTKQELEKRIDEIDKRFRCLGY